MGAVRVKRELGELVAAAWAMACDTRSEITTPWIRQWPEELMTRAEKKRLLKMRRLLAEAVDEACALQASLSRRSKELGVDTPDYERARNAG